MSIFQAIFSFQILIISTHLTTVSSQESHLKPTITSQPKSNETIELLKNEVQSTRIGKRELPAPPLPIPAQLKLRRRPAQKRTKPTYQRRRRRPSAKQQSQPKPVYGPPNYNYGDTLANYPGPNEIGYSYNTNNNNNFQQQTKFYNTLNPNFTYTPPYIPPSGDSYANYGSRQPQTYQQEFEPSAPSYPNSGQSFAEPPRPTQQQNIGYSYPTNSYIPIPQQQLNTYQTLPKQYRNEYVPPIPQKTIQQSINPYRNVIPTPSLELEYQTNGKNTYDTPISSYDVPLNYDEQRPTNYRSQTTEGYQQPPELPNTYDQESFNLFAKDKYNRAIIHSQPIDFIPERNYFDVNYGSRKKTPPPTNLNAFANLDDDLPDDDYIDEIITTTIAPTRRRRYRRRRPSTAPPSHNLDTDDLRDSYNSGSKINQVVVRPDFQKISKPMELKGQTNFVLNSAKNNFKPTESSARNKFDIISIEKSKSHSYYGGTMATDIDSSQMNIVSSGIFVGSEHDAGTVSGARNGYVVKDSNFSDRNDVFFDRYNAAGFKSVRHRDKSLRSVDTTTKTTTTLVWDGKNLPKNHKITSRDRTV